MTITTDALRGDLAALGAQSESVRQVDNDLTRAAGDRRAWIDPRLDELRPHVHTDRAAADEYEALVAERGQLDTTFPA